jgi:hypothetical protein
MSVSKCITEGVPSPTKKPKQHKTVWAFFKRDELVVMSYELVVSSYEL